MLEQLTAIQRLLNFQTALRELSARYDERVKLLSRCVPSDRHFLETKRRRDELMAAAEKTVHLSLE